MRGRGWVWSVGVLACTGGGAPARIDGSCDDSDDDGRCADVDLCVGDDLTGDADRDGVCGDRDRCPAGRDDDDADMDGVPAGCDACPDTPGGQTVDATGCPAGADTGDTGAAGDSGDSGAGDSGAVDTGDLPEVGDFVESAWVGKAFYVPPGTSTMGCVVGRDDVEGTSCTAAWESPSHAVTLTEGLWVMESELTQGQWSSLGFPNPSYAVGGTRPVERVLWWEALAAANAASVKDGLAACYVLSGCSVEGVGQGRTCTGMSVTAPSGLAQDCEGWRLPTEAEWERAARGGTSQPFPGSDDPDTVAWSADTVGAKGTAGYRPRDVCGKARNGYGLCDMSGNVAEFTADAPLAYTAAAQTDPAHPAPDGIYAVLRGGGFHQVVGDLRVVSRGNQSLGVGNSAVGFRLVRTAR